MNDERRQSERATRCTKVECEVAGIHAETRVADMNLSGVFIDTLCPLPVGAALKLSFIVPGGQRFDTESVVVHSRQGIGMGVAFTTLKAEDAKLIQEAIKTAAMSVA